MGKTGRRNFLTISAAAITGARLQSPRAGIWVNAASNERTTMDIERIGITEPAGGIPIISFATIHAGLVYL